MKMRDRLGVRLYEDWKRLPKQRRRDVKRAVEQGRAVADPRDAELAVRLADARERELAEQPRGRWSVAVIAVSGLLGVAALISATVATVRGDPAVWVLAAGFGTLELLVFVRRGPSDEEVRRQAADARAANEPLIPGDAFRGA
jgi:hypothetical protein